MVRNTVPPPSPRVIKLTPSELHEMLEIREIITNIIGPDTSFTSALMRSPDVIQPLVDRYMDLTLNKR